MPVSVVYVSRSCRLSVSRLSNCQGIRFEEHLNRLTICCVSVDVGCVRFCLVFMFLYVQPKLAIYVGSILRAPRLIRHDGNLTHFFSPVRDEQLEYVDGLMVVSSIFLILFVFWAFMLVVLKVKGREVGCASGRAFVTAHWEESSNDDTEGDYADEAISTTSSSSESYSSKPLVSDQHAEHRDISRATKKSSRTKDTMMVLRQNSTDPIEGDRSLDRSPSNCSDMVWEGSANVAVEDNDDNDQNGPLHPIIFNPLERRTRICFLLSASIALIMVPFILVFSFGSLTDAMQSSDTLILVRFSRRLRQ